MVDAALAAEITQALPIPTIGIGAGPSCDGQVLVLHDVLGLYPESPPFARRFVDLSAVATSALSEFAAAVRDRSFPD
jgi:3-methyl-2-oxobutanoate hydroxymethyltransferase